MDQSIAARATSLAVSASLLGLAVFAAFTASITLGVAPLGESVIDVVRLPPEPPPAPPPTTRTQPPPPTAAHEPDETVLPLDPVAPTEILSTEVASFGPPGPPTITNPRWLRQPRDLGRYYPSRALARNIGGQAVLDCLVDTSGALNCAVVSETPTNWGFGEAALRIARDYRMVPASQDGRPVEARYRMRVPFEVD